MARVGGRSTPIAALAAMGIIAVLAGLAYLAAPLMPASLSWAETTVNRSAVWLVDTARDALVALTVEE